MTDQGFDIAQNIPEIEIFRSPLIRSFTHGATQQLVDAHIIEKNEESPDVNSTTIETDPNLVKFLLDEHPTLLFTPNSVFEGILYTPNEDTTRFGTEILELFAKTLYRNGASIEEVHERLNQIIADKFPSEIQDYFNKTLGIYEPISKLNST